MASAPASGAPRTLSRAELAIYAALLLGAFALTWLVVQGRLLPSGTAIVVHIALEAVSIVVAVLVFAVAWNAQEARRVSALTLLGCAFLAVAILDFLDSVAFEGMPVGLAAPYTARGIWFFVLGRVVTATALAAFAWWPAGPRVRGATRWWCLGGALLLCAAAVAVVFSLPTQPPPVGTVPPARVAAALAVVGLSLAAAWGFLRRYRASGESKDALLLLACLATGLSEAFLSTHAEPYALQSAAGHLFKLTSRLLIYGSIFISAIREPYERAQRLQAELAQSESRLSGILHSAMDAIVTVDENQRILFFNEAAERVFLCPAHDAVGGPLERFIPERYRSAHAAHVRRFAAADASPRMMGAHRVLPGLRADGEEFPMEASISALTIGGTRLLTVILRDVTARMSAELELAEAKDELREISLASQSAR